ncbi:MAG: DNA polymerase III subunit beta [Cellulomonadaceae bacterium]|jgi:DNA polymerase-3 subunit beta|nr:DNA polymerase III subunit beta [Cellulomonadaceae bacterium]
MALTERNNVKLTINKDVLSDAVGFVARVLPLRPAAPILQGMLLKADTDGTVTFTAFDYEISARAKVEADVEEAGEVLVSGRLLAAIASALPNGTVTVDAEGSKVAIKAGNAAYALQTMPLAEYPVIPQVPATTGTMDSETFKSLVNKVTVAAASKEDANPVFAGVRVKVANDKVNLAATDRYRLSQLDAEWNNTNPEINTTLLVKAKVLQDVAKNLGQSGDNIEIGLNTDGGLDIIGFSAGGKQTTAQLIDGQFPAVESLFPESQPIHAVVSRTALIDAVKRVALVSDGIVKLAFREGEVEVKAGQGDEAHASESLPSDLVGEDITIAVKPVYLLDGLNAIPDAFVRVSFTGPIKPVELSGQETLSGDRDYLFRYLVVPFRLPEGA